MTLLSVPSTHQFSAVTNQAFDIPGWCTESSTSYHVKLPAPTWSLLLRLPRVRGTSLYSDYPELSTYYVIYTRTWYYQYP